MIRNAREGAGRRARKYTDGWEAGVLAVFVAWAVAVLTVPRTVEPDVVPLPRVDSVEVAALRQRWDEEAARAEAEELDSSVRLLGARMRVYGRAERAGVPGRIEAARREVLSAAAPAVRDRPEQVVALAAHHGKLMATAFEAWIESGVESDDLQELGGDATAAFRANGWVPERGQIEPDLDLVIRALHRRRFVALVGSLPIETDRAETILLGRFMLARSAHADFSADARLGATTLRRIDEVVAVDPTYPATYARGIVFYRMGRFEAAAADFDAFLAASDSGPYRIRAANYLKASVELAAP